MNTIKFAPYNELITEQHNLEVAPVKEATIGDKIYKFYSPCNLNVSVSNICQNNCDFCINKEHKELCSDKEYYRGLERALSKLSNVDCEFTLTGGEPTLNSERFIKTCEILKKFGIKERTISTTGIGLLNMYKGKPVLAHLREMDFIHNISISRMAFDEELNDNLLKGKNIKNKDLEKLAFFSKINGIEMRVSTNFLKGSVHDYNSMIKFLNDMKNIGINTVLFRELVGVPRSIKIKPIQDKISNSSDFKFDKTLTGIFYDVDVYLYPKFKPEYIVKCYRDKKPTEKVIGSLFYNAGTLRIGFNGEIL